MFASAGGRSKFKAAGGAGEAVGCPLAHRSPSEGRADENKRGTAGGARHT